MMRATFAIAGAIAALATGPQQATFSSRAVAVRVDVSVTEHGQPVAGLTSDDFEVFDNGVRQDITLVDSEELPIDLVMALDMSGSVSGTRRDDLTAASHTVLQLLKADDRVGVLTFDQQVILRTPLTGDLEEVRRGLNRAGGRVNRTALIDAAYAALAQAEGGQGRALVIVFSDGVDTASWLRTEDVIETAKRLDVVLFGVSTGAPDRNVLDDLADASGGDLIRIESTKVLTATLETLMRDFRQRYVLSYSPRDVRQEGWHTLDVRVKRRGLRVKARQGYFAS